MLAQVTLIPTESKKLIAKAIVQMKEVKQAAASGTIAIAPSSSTYFIATELLGGPLPTDVWACGLIAPRGACVEEGTTAFIKNLLAAEPPQPVSAAPDPGGYRATHVIHRGKYEIGERLDSILERLGPKDVYIKGANAIDPQGNVAILTGNRIKGGTSAFVSEMKQKKGFNLIIAVGLEKMIPISIGEAVRLTERRPEFEYGMGIQCILYPVKGKVITEPDAIKILSGATATPVASGGIGGAEGSITMVIQGEKEKIRKAIQYIEECKGATLPPVRLASCEICTSHCDFPLKGKAWA